MDIILIPIVIAILVIPFILTGFNIFSFFKFIRKKEDPYYYKGLEVIGIMIGLIYLYYYVDISDVKFVEWSKQLVNLQKHSMISPEYFPTIVVLCVVAFIGYTIVRFIAPENQSPILSAVGIAAIYLGIAICIIWCIQITGNFFLVLYGGNCLLIFVKTVCIIVYKKNELVQTKKVNIKYKWLSDILNKTNNLPWIAFVFAIPLLGVLVALLFLFGQEPDSIIKAWVETADWNLSQREAPPNARYDEHYLCTVAAGGHEKVVKPIRPGIRHGHEVVVNRQLCIANAFEQVLEEKVTVFHKVVRTMYDTIGYPISKHIRTKFAADIVYIIMKPLEILFLIVLYTVDTKPEDRIAVQYPHTKIPHYNEQKGV